LIQTGEYNIVAKKLYVGNLSFNVTQAQIRELFSEVGEVVDVYITVDRWTATPKGFGFVEMATAEATQEVIQRFHGYLLLNRPLTIHEVAHEENAGKTPLGTVIFRKSPPATP
jgi:RNA recognition motif-containing protein